VGTTSKSDRAGRGVDWNRAKPRLGPTRTLYSSFFMIHSSPTASIIDPHAPRLMDSDQAPGPDPQAVLAAGHVPDDAALESLADVLEQLEATPDNVPSIRRQIALMRELGMADEVQATVLKLASLIMLDEGESTYALALTPDLWLSHLDNLISRSPRPLSLDSFLDIAEQFEQAEQDYLCKLSCIARAEASSRNPPSACRVHPAVRQSVLAFASGNGRVSSHCSFRRCHRAPAGRHSSHHARSCGAKGSTPARGEPPAVAALAGIGNGITERQGRARTVSSAHRLL
jgi:hypothetical protein